MTLIVCADTPLLARDCRTSLRLHLCCKDSKRRLLAEAHVVMAAAGVFHSAAITSEHRRNARAKRGFTRLWLRVSAHFEMRLMRCLRLSEFALKPKALAARLVAKMLPFARARALARDGARTKTSAD